MKIFFDLDGTLIDSKIRLYLLFQYLVKESELSFDEYWKFKRNKKTHQYLLENIYNYNCEKIEVFEKEWMKQIEEDAWLDYDKPFNGVEEFLISLKKREINLFVVTARQYKEKAIKQLNGFGWEGIFDEVLVTEQKTDKAKLIRPFINENEILWIVGDTSKDIQTGKTLNIKTAAVSSGFLNFENLLKYQPDILITSVIEFEPFKYQL